MLIWWDYEYGHSSVNIRDSGELKALPQTFIQQTPVQMSMMKFRLKRVQG